MIAGMLCYVSVLSVCVYCCRKVAVTQDNNVLVFHAPGQTIEFNPFVLYRTFYGAYDETSCIDWTSDSR